jgi:5-(carboxyamino)imidazole ribonucleotide synthase
MIPPGSQIGLLGGGQLARMTALAGRRLGYRFCVFDPTGAAAPAAPVCERFVGAPFDDADALAEFARGLDVIGFEFENIPPVALQTLERFCPVRPSWRALEICQHREREKQFLERSGYPHAAFRVATNPAELDHAIRDLGAPCVLKTAQSGYDGKGQLRIDPGLSADEAWCQWGGGPGARGVVEAWVDFEAELSVICARNPAGELVAFPAVENIHTHHILDLSIAPARFPPAIIQRAGELAAAITETLGIEGLLAVEMFLTRSGELLVNELAPRPHNSGHLTFDAALTSQFEQHIRAICGLPLGEPRLHTPAVMVNLLGQLWGPDFEAPDWSPVLREPAAKLHLYGKHSAKPGRKMGHYCVLDPSREVALEKALAIKARLEGRAQSV